MAFRGDHMSKGIEREKLSNCVETAKTGLCSRARTQSVPYKQWEVTRPGANGEAGLAGTRTGGTDMG